MHIEFNDDHRRIFADKLLEVANLAVAGLLFGQFLSGRQFSIPAALAGVVIAIIVYILAYLILRRRKKK